MSWFRFWQRYAKGDMPWDTGIVPPEIVTLIEADGLPAGEALDIGCGTGSTSIYLARHGWQVRGLDFVPRALRIARRKAREAGVADRASFELADIRRERFRRQRARHDLLIDIGCGHVLPAEEWALYAAALARMSRPGATLMIYLRRASPDGPRGLDSDFVEATLGQSFDLIWRVFSTDTGSGWPSAWYRFQRRD